MKVLFISIIGLMCINISAQPTTGTICFKREGKTNSTIGIAYVVNSLTLRNDSCFVWQELLFNSKKERKECIPSNYQLKKGKWDKCEDTIRCYVIDSTMKIARIERFYYSCNKLYYFTYPIKDNFFRVREKYGWEKVKLLNSDIVLK
jgi:hypothetical protein